MEPQGATAAQAWTLEADGSIRSVANASLCLAQGDAGAYSVTLTDCATRADAWTLASDVSEIHHVKSGFCLDVRSSDGVVGTWSCGADGVQTNQRWAFDPQSQKLVSMDSDAAFGGMCLTADV